MLDVTNITQRLTRMNSTKTRIGMLYALLAGPIGGLFGVVGAIIVSTLYKESIKRWSTLIGVVAIGVGVWLALTGGKIVSPTHGVYALVGILIMVAGTINWGFENFAIAAGSDLMRAVLSGGEPRLPSFLGLY